MVDSDTKTPNLEQQQPKRTRLGRLMGAGINKLFGLYAERDASPETIVRRYTFDENDSGIQTIDVYSFGHGVTVDRSWTTAQSPEETVIVEYTHPETGATSYTLTQYADMYQNPNSEEDHQAASHWVVKRQSDGQLSGAVAKNETYLSASDLTAKDMHMGRSRRVIRATRGREPLSFNDIAVAPADGDPSELLGTVLGVEAAAMNARLESTEL